MQENLVVKKATPLGARVWTSLLVFGFIGQIAAKRGKRKNARGESSPGRCYFFRKRTRRLKENAPARYRAGAAEQAKVLCVWGKVVNNR